MHVIIVICNLHPNYPTMGTSLQNENNTEHRLLLSPGIIAYCRTNHRIESSIGNIYILLQKFALVNYVLHINMIRVYVIDINTDIM